MGNRHLRLRLRPAVRARRARIGLVYAVTFLVMGAGTRAEAPVGTGSGAQVPAGAEQFMSLDEVRPGMRGIGYSVFSREGQSSFDVEIIDILHQSAPHRNIILAELDGPVVNEAGIVAGMSGSPVYIDGRLVGAVAYGWSFSKRPIAGITPIREMIDVMESPEPVPDFSAIPDAESPMPADFGALETQTPVSRPPDGFRSIGVPLLVSGLSREAAALLRDRFEPLGFTLTQGAVSGSEQGSASLRPGDPVSIPLVRGDASVAAFGTITFSDGDRLVAFGHPVFHTARQKLPMAGGRVIGVLPSQLQSFKFASSLEPIGYFYSDQAPGAAAKLGNPPPMLPVHLVLASAAGEATFDFEVVRDQFLTAQLVQAVTMTALTSELHRSGLGTLRTSVTVTLSNGSVIQHDDIIATVNAPEMLAAGAAGPVSDLIINPYVEPMLERVDIRGQIDEDVRISSIDAVEVLDRPAHPGETIRIRVTLRPYRGELREIILPLELPPSTPTGTAVLKVCDPISLAEWDRERSADKYRPRSYGQFLEQVRQSPTHNRLVARLFVSGYSLVVAGRELSSLPPSVRAALEGANGAGQRSTAEGIEVVTATMELDEHVLGCQTLNLEVVEK